VELLVLPFVILLPVLIAATLIIIGGSSNGSTLAPCTSAQRWAWDNHRKVFQLSGGEWSKGVQKLWNFIFYFKLNKRVLNLIFLVEIALILKNDIMSCMNRVHGILVALAYRKKTLEVLEDDRLALGWAGTIRRGRNRRLVGCYSCDWGNMRLKISVFVVFHKGLLGHMLKHRHNERSICTCPSGGDSYISNLIEDVVEDIELYLALDGMDEVPLINRNTQ
jgi:hypothetical protein